MNLLDLQETEEILALADAAEEAVIVLQDGAITPHEALPGSLHVPTLSAENIQELLHGLQWKLACFAERCFWSTLTAKKSSASKVIAELSIYFNAWEDKFGEHI